ncbi:T5orf172 domain-containing protein [Ancylomarina subtilis]|uniref:T5orf172 domain-containing protein n=1 Tax=Ancylomarina subtilis TaxID=1639035 RepID=A0A4Q7VKS2_9BACT|nr:GIY-YIG nuclease family protein [Ancylomarina subtilis]RZT96638.1 T5orf172 domain-containing protein [Ancylomarina subtilis]
MNNINEHTQHLYMMYDNVNKLTKIGIAKRPEIRLKQIQNALGLTGIKLIDVVYGKSNKEKELHKMFSEYRVDKHPMSLVDDYNGQGGHTEWFKLDKKTRNKLKKIYKDLSEDNKSFEETYKFYLKRDILIEKEYKMHMKGIKTNKYISKVLYEMSERDCEKALSVPKDKRDKEQNSCIKFNNSMFYSMKETIKKPENIYYTNIIDDKYFIKYKQFNYNNEDIRICQKLFIVNKEPIDLHEVIHHIYCNNGKIDSLFDNLMDTESQNINLDTHSKMLDVVKEELKYYLINKGYDNNKLINFIIENTKPRNVYSEAEISESFGLFQN